MVPVPTIVEGWHEEKVDELFASLLGRNKQSSKARVEEERENIAVKVPKDGFKIFG
jgi:protein AATF/BFR2